MTEEVIEYRRDMPVGKVFSDRFEIVSLVGEGGMGLVYKARHLLMNRIVAIKILRSELVSNQTLLLRFHQEAMAVSQLNHPNIVAVHDFGVTSDGTSFLVMDYLDGTSLSDIIIEEGNLPLSRAVPIFLQACRALQHAHHKGIIHRDFKSSNLMICREGGRKDLVKVVDFGMAKLLRADATDSVRFQELTQSGDVFGSPLYMSPEQCRGQKLDERSDIFSLGCVMYYAISGQPPCRGDNVLDTLHRQINEVPRSLNELDSAVPENLSDIIAKALRKDPEERYQSIGDLIIDLEAVAFGRDPIVVTRQLPKLTMTSAYEHLERSRSRETAAAASKPGDTPTDHHSGNWVAPAVVAEAKPKQPRLLGHNFELGLVFCVFLCAILIASTAFVSGRMFEVADENQEANMWADRNIEGDHARAAGKFAEAERCYKEAVTEALKFGKNDPRMAKSLVSLGATYGQDHQFNRADVVLKQSLQILEKAYGPECPELSTALVTLARTYEQQGRHDEAQELRNRALALLEQRGETTARLEPGSETAARK